MWDSRPRLSRSSEARLALLAAASQSAIKSIVASVCTAIAAPLRARFGVTAPGGGKRTNTHDLPTPDRSCFLLAKGSHANLRVLPSRKRNPFHRDARSESRCARLHPNTATLKFLRRPVHESSGCSFRKRQVGSKAVGNSQARPQPGRHQDPRQRPLLHRCSPYSRFVRTSVPRVLGHEPVGEIVELGPASPPARLGTALESAGYKKEMARASGVCAARKNCARTLSPPGSTCKAATLSTCWPTLTPLCPSRLRSATSRPPRFSAPVTPCGADFALPIPSRRARRCRRHRRPRPPRPAVFQSLWLRHHCRHEK